MKFNKIFRIKSSLSKKFAYCTLFIALGLGVQSNTFASILNQSSISTPSITNDLKLLSNASLIGATNPNTNIEILVWLATDKQQELDIFLEELYTPDSHNYHKYLTSKEFIARFSPTSENANAVKDYLISQGFTNLSIPSNRFFIQVNTTVGQVQKAFKVKINNYNYQNKQIYSNDRAPAIDLSISNMISDITGLDNIVQMEPQYVIMNNNQKTVNTQLGILRPPYNPKQYQRAYGIDKLINSGLNGSGESIAIINAYDDPNAEADLKVFNTRYGLDTCTTINGCFLKLNQKGQPFPLPSFNSGWSTEIAMDIETAHGIAPKANIILVEADNAYLSSMYTALNTVVNNQLANVVSNSWGAYEAMAGKQLAQELIFKQAAAQGININAASGDNGDAASVIGSIGVLYPASSSWVTAIGGTALVLANDGSYQSETGWASTTNDSGSGGGVSKFYLGQPQQTKVIQNKYLNGYGFVSNRRALPDISMEASPSVGGASVYNSLGGGWLQVGGTSLASPMFSGLAAIFDQGLSLQGKQPVGLIATSLYGLPYNSIQGLTPITNIIKPTWTAYSVLAAGFGWSDMVGVGTPYAPILFQSLVAAH